MNGTRASAGGSLAAALASAATWFCCLPLATGILGTSMSAFAASFGRYRFLFSALAIGLLALAFRQSYRSKGACRDGECEPSRVRRQRFLLWVVTVMTLALLSIQWWSSWAIYVFIT